MQMLPPNGRGRCFQRVAGLKGSHLGAVLGRLGRAKHSPETLFRFGGSSRDALSRSAQCIDCKFNHQPLALLLALQPLGGRSRVAAEQARPHSNWSRVGANGPLETGRPKLRAESFPSARLALRADEERRNQSDNQVLQLGGSQTGEAGKTAE